MHQTIARMIMVSLASVPPLNVSTVGAKFTRRMTARMTTVSLASVPPPSVTTVEAKNMRQMTALTTASCALRQVINARTMGASIQKFIVYHAICLPAAIPVEDLRPPHIPSKRPIMRIQMQCFLNILRQATS